MDQPRIVQQEEYIDEGPIYYCDIGGEKVLLVWGQWMFDPWVYGREAESDSDDWPPFPASSFTLHRTTTSGRVVRVQVTGSRIQPERVLPARAIRLAGLPESLVMDGDFNDLPGLMRKAKRLRGGNEPGTACRK